MEKTGVRIYDSASLDAFALAVLKAAKVRGDVADLVARGLLSASLRGVDSHGIRLLPHYVNGVIGGRLNPDPRYDFKKTAAATGTFDADHTFGHAAGIEAMRKAMELAGDAGAGHVAVFNSSHCGTAAYFVLEAAKAGFIGLAFTHANSLLNTPGSTRAFFGLNPIAMAAPCAGEEPFCYDSAPSVITWNKLLQYKQAGKKLPPGLAADADGNETDDPEKATQLLPIGGYKGFGLSMIVDILCGLLTGMPVGREISNMYEAPLSQKRDLGQFYIAMRIDSFQAPELFKGRMQQLMDDVRREPKREGVDAIGAPGDPEKRTAAQRLSSGIPVAEGDIIALSNLGESLGVIFPEGSNDQ